MEKEIGQIVLIVDDDLDDQLLIRDAFREVSPALECIYLTGGRELMEFLRTDERSPKVALIILDLNMPIMNGWETLRLLRSIPSRSIPAVVLTTSNREKDRVYSLSLGAVAFYSKPCHLEEFRKILEFICVQWIPHWSL